MAITSAFQADDAGSIPATRSKKFSSEKFLPKLQITHTHPKIEIGDLPAPINY